MCFVADKTNTARMFNSKQSIMIGYKVVAGYYRTSLSYPKPGIVYKFGNRVNSRSKVPMGTRHMAAGIYVYLTKNNVLVRTGQEMITVVFNPKDVIGVDRERRVACVRKVLVVT